MRRMMYVYTGRRPGRRWTWTDGPNRKTSKRRSDCTRKGVSDMSKQRLQQGADGHQDLEASTAMFGRLADPNGANNALSQVLYGLALR